MNYFQRQSRFDAVVKQLVFFKALNRKLKGEEINYEKIKENY
jgi:hypothetical protein